MSITEKELAEKLREECDTNRHNGWSHAARKIAEALGVELAPAKPEPGTWHVVTEGPYEGRRAYVNVYRTLMVFSDCGDYDTLEAGQDWPTLTPAEPVELTEEEVGELWNASDHPSIDWSTWRDGTREAITATVNAALKSHGHGPMKGDLIGHMAPVVTREQVGAVVSRGLARTGGYTYARTQDVTDAVMDLLDAS